MLKAGNIYGWDSQSQTVMDAIAQRNHCTDQTPRSGNRQAGCGCIMPVNGGNIWRNRKTGLAYGQLKGWTRPSPASGERRYLSVVQGRNAGNDNPTVNSWLQDRCPGGNLKVRLRYKEAATHCRNPKNQKPSDCHQGNERPSNGISQETISVGSGPPSGKGRVVISIFALQALESMGISLGP